MPSRHGIMLRGGVSAALPNLTFLCTITHAVPLQVMLIFQDFERDKRMEILSGYQR
jgi:hypothetical protein